MSHNFRPLAANFICYFLDTKSGRELLEQFGRVRDGKNFLFFRLKIFDILIYFAVIGKILKKIKYYLKKKSVQDIARGTTIRVGISNRFGVQLYK